ncbi:glycosyltransferase [Opitutaceae bacterium EW11]|nr:glycosyltransferase [Opitutaceae bacterium EW11]
MPPVPPGNPPPAPPRFNVLGVGVNALTLPRATHLVVEAGRSRAGGYVCFCDVNSASCARRDALHRGYLNRSRLTTPDGMPIVWLAHRQGFRDVSRVYGPDLLLAVCEATAGTGLSHYFLGAAPGTAAELAGRLKSRFPGLSVAGVHAPPYRALNDTELDDLSREMTQKRPAFLWIGLSTPKQERFMAEHSSRWDVGLSLGVGAAFDFLSGRVSQAPRWIQRSGTEWVWRLFHEPRRLAPRYLRNNPAFVIRAAAQLCGLIKYPVD